MNKDNKSIADKLLNLRVALRKETFTSFDEFVDVIIKKSKYYKILPLFSFLNGDAVLKILDLDGETETITFCIPADKVTLQNAKEQLYKMAFDVESIKKGITPKQYIELLERMKELKVDEKDILARYHIKSMAEMTLDIYQRCMTVLDKMNTGSSQ